MAELRVLRWVRSPLVRGVVGGLLFVVGIPGLLEGGGTWLRWLAVMGPRTSGILVGGGGLLLLLGTISLLERVISKDSAEQPEEPTAVDYIGAMGIVDAYLHPALVDMRDGVKLTVKQDFIDRFERTTGAKLGEYAYNRRLLHRWMGSNAAYLLVKYRNEMR